MGRRGAQQGRRLLGNPASCSFLCLSQLRTGPPGRRYCPWTSERVKTQGYTDRVCEPLDSHTPPPARHSTTPPTTGPRPHTGVLRCKREQVRPVCGRGVSPAGSASPVTPDRGRGNRGSRKSSEPRTASDQVRRVEQPRSPPGRMGITVRRPTPLSRLVHSPCGARALRLERRSRPRPPRGLRSNVHMHPGSPQCPPGTQRLEPVRPAGTNLPGSLFSCARFRGRKAFRPQACLHAGATTSVPAAGPTPARAIDAPTRLGSLGAAGAGAPRSQGVASAGTRHPLCPK